MCNCLENTVVSEKWYTPPEGCATPASVKIKVVKMGNREVHVPREEYTKIIACFHLTCGNGKTGKEMQVLSFPIWFSCLHGAPCFLVDPETVKFSPTYQCNMGESKCYGMGDNFERFPQNAIKHAETFKALLDWTEERLVDAFIAEIKPETTVVRLFEIGDLTPKMLRVIVKVARHFESEGRKINFYGYTKKYIICNNFVANNGGTLKKAFPKNLNILFSEWEGLEMPNPYNFPVSAFVPFENRENLVLSKGDFICPCSFPEWGGTCLDCGQCQKCRAGNRVYLVEHSTENSRDTDREAHEKQKALKEAYTSLKQAVMVLTPIGGDTLKQAERALKAFKKNHIDKFVKRA